MLALLNQIGYLTVGVGCTAFGMYFAVVALRQVLATGWTRHTTFYVGVAANMLGEGPGKIWFTAFRWLDYPPWMVEHPFVTFTLYLTIAGLVCHGLHIHMALRRRRRG